ncbi:TetR family transcriptional regulator [Streptomyces sp. NPDC054794]
MQTTDALGRTARRSDARSNRRLILAIARHRLRDDPDAGLDSIAQGAGVARRALYGRFSSREALVAELTRSGPSAPAGVRHSRCPGGRSARGDDADGPVGMGGARPVPHADLLGATPPRR